MSGEQGRGPPPRRKRESRPGRGGDLNGANDIGEARINTSGGNAPAPVIRFHDYYIDRRLAEYRKKQSGRLRVAIAQFDALMQDQEKSLPTPFSRDCADVALSDLADAFKFWLGWQVR